MRTLLARRSGSALLAALAAAPALAAPPALSLAESVPLETTLDDPAIPEAADVWLEMVRGARTRLDLAQFYVATAPGSRLEAVLAEIEAAADRGVQVRLLADAKFANTYPETLARLDARDRVEVRRLDLAPRTGGVLHAKYFLVDGERAWIGSQNFDWRSLEHVAELGLQITEPAAVADLAAVFAQDWALAGGQAAATASDAPPATVAYGEGEVQVRLVASPEALLPPGVDWDLPALLDMIGAAKERVRVQLLSYAVVGYDEQAWPELDEALRAAAARGVSVELLVADWSKKPPKLDAIQALARVPGVEVRFVSIPEWSGGFIPFARVVHSKYMTVDGRRAWLGTSNWSRDYFHASRNVGVVVDGPAFAADLDRYFERLWASTYAETVDPDRAYTAPRVK